MNYKMLYYLMNENHSLVEVKTGENDFHWLSIVNETKKVERLVFKSMSEEVVKGNPMNVRTFNNAELRFDKSYAKFVIGDTGHILMNCSDELIPPEIDELILKALKHS